MKSSNLLRLHHSPRAIVNFLLSILICLFFVGIKPTTAAPPSQHYYVDNFSDVRINTGCQDGVSDGDCDLRGAIDLANAGSSSYWHHIHLPAGTYTLTRVGDDENANSTGDLDVDGPALLLVGAGMNNTVITQSVIAERIIDHMGSHSLQLIDLTISGGRMTAGGGGGGGIRSITTGQLVLENVRITNNQVAGTDDDDAGGGIFIYNTNLIVTGSIIEDNRAVNGGGLAIYNLYDGATATIKTSTIYDNYAYPGNGGGIWAEIHSSLNLENVTIVENIADDLGNGGGLYIHNNTAAVLNHVTDYDNWAGGLGDAIFGDGVVHLDVDNSIFYWRLGGDVCNFPIGSTLYIASNGNNINNGETSGICKIGAGYNTDPLLGELGFYHATTLTLPPLSGSPAIDGAIADDPVTTDQRGKPRYDGDEDGTIESDIGAHENCLEYFLPLILVP
jgi:hypothetical protein